MCKILSKTFTLLHYKALTLCPFIHIKVVFAVMQSYIHLGSECVSLHTSVGCNLASFVPLLSPSCSHAPVGGMLHSEQQRHIVMETATTLHHHRGRIHPRAGRWKRGAIQGRFPCAGTVLSLQAGIYLSASAVFFVKWELLWYLHLDPKTKSEKQDQLEYKSPLCDMLSFCLGKDSIIWYQGVHWLSQGNVAAVFCSWNHSS